MSINILPKQVYTLIAAGEVVSRPVSIVKELIENAIDANASNIVLEIRDGGISYIKISDNGSGMDSEDLHKSIQPHATSKVCTATDLDNILTLGFRGEALASIVAVAKVVIKSKVAGDDIGNFISVVSGQIIDSGQVGCPQGTSIEITNLFDDIPARKKFLKRASTEQSYITSMIEKLALSASNIKIKYIADGKEVLNTGGTGILDAIYSAWGASVARNMVRVSANKEEVGIYGYIGNSQNTRHNASHQLLIVNGRVVEDIGIAKVVYNCLSVFLMTRQFPVFVLFVTLPSSDVDVNIHPHKQEVRFVNKDIVNSLVAHVCKQSMYIDDDISNNGDNLQELAFANNQPQSNAIIGASDPLAKTSSTFDVVTPSLRALNLLSSNSNNSSHSYVRESGASAVEALLNNMSNTTASGGVSYNSAQGTVDTLHTIVPLMSFDSGNNNLPSNNEPLSANYATIIGTLFDTYIVLQAANCIYLVDQHAAHEKLLYDKLCKQIDSMSLRSQALLAPFVFSLGAIQADKLLDILPKFSDIGLDIRRLTDKEFAIMSIPTMCIDMRLNQFVGEIVAIIDDKKIFGSSEILSTKLKQVACKAAVKAGDRLNDSEISALLDDIQKSDTALFCPHGRPLSYRLSKTDIEKWFKRIV